MLVNGDCEVLKGQCRRSQAGLWYHGAEEFREAFLWLTAEENGPQARALAANGRRYVEQTYRWQGIIEKYGRALAEVSGSDPQPG